MKSLAKKVAVAVATGALLANSILPAFAEITVVVTGNGANTDNTANLSQTTSTVVNQTNTANISNDVDSVADTGKNDANYNTGGSVSVTTGPATSDVKVANTVNSNEAVVDCQTCPADVKVEISGNGADSKKDDPANTVNLNLSNTTWVNQTNTANMKNDVDSVADTGKNDADYNTGGDVTIKTGIAKAGATVVNQANANVAHVGSSGSGALELLIVGNGADTTNTINAVLGSTVGITQSNFANISNDVTVLADTGKNDADYNTGGSVSVLTGNATAGAEVDNMANFNYASVEDCCEFDGKVK